MALVTANIPVSPNRFRLSPGVDRIQTTSAYTRIFHPNHGHQHNQPRFSGPRGWGSRHVNDPMPFTLWEETDRRFRIPTKDERDTFMQRCNAERVEFLGHLAVVTTSNPPQPLPLTVASMPVVFVPPSPESEPTPTHSMLGSFFEVDAMSTDLVEFMFEIVTMEKPVRPPGHPPVPCIKWRRYNVMRIFGAQNADLANGMCGAPFVECDTGAVAGFFHLVNGDHAVSAGLDDLIAEGWSIC